jgi:DNA-binding beta-propeller fold protein YncE
VNFLLQRARSEKAQPTCGKCCRPNLVFLPAILIVAISISSCTSTLTPTPMSISASTPTLNPTPMPVATSTPTLNPTSQSRFHPTSTPTHALALTSTPTLTPIQGPEALLPTAGPLCENSLSSPMTRGTPKPHILGLIKVSYAEDNQWTLYPPLAHGSPSEVQTLICIHQDRRKTSDVYTDGQPGYVIVWEARIVSWPDGLVFGRIVLEGLDPPYIKRGSGPGYGEEPGYSFEKWLSVSLDGETVLYAGVDIESVTFSPDGALLASGSCATDLSSESPTCPGGQIQLWDVATGNVVRTLHGHADTVTSVAFSPDGQTLVSASEGDDTVILWDITTGQKLNTLDDRDIGLFTEVALSPNGRLWAWGDFDDFEHTVALWDVTAGQRLHTLIGHKDGVTSVTFSPDGQNLASGSCGGFDSKESWKCITSEIRVWDVETGQELRTLLSQDNTKVASLDFSPDGRTLASGTRDGAVILWDTATWQIAHTPHILHARHVTDVAFSPDGQILASGSSDATVILWDATTMQKWRKLNGHIGSVTSVAFSPDGKTLASGSTDETIILWNVKMDQ